jgi:hypothetical protein
MKTLKVVNQYGTWAVIENDSRKIIATSSTVEESNSIADKLGKIIQVPVILFSDEAEDKKYRMPVRY